jgi:hypothetical protein
MLKENCVFWGSAGILPALSGILPGSKTSAIMSLRLRRAHKPAGKMPAGASRMLSLPEQRANNRRVIS